MGNGHRVARGHLVQNGPEITRFHGRGTAAKGGSHDARLARRPVARASGHERREGHEGHPVVLGHVGHEAVVQRQAQIVGIRPLELGRRQVHFPGVRVVLGRGGGGETGDGQQDGPTPEPGTHGCSSVAGTPRGVRERATPTDRLSGMK